MTATFGVLSPFVGGDYYGAIIAGLNAAAVAAGDRVLALQTLNPGSYSADRSGLPDYHRPVSWRHLSGLAVLPGAVDAAYARTARLAGLPVVSVGEQLDGCPAVLADSRSGVREAVDHLIEVHGHQRIAFAGHLSHFDVRERHEGHRAAMIAHGLPADLLYETGDNHESGGEVVAADLIRAGMPATAIVLGTDRNAIGLIHRLTAAGFDLPGDLAVVGFDDIADAMYLRPSLATVRQPLDRLGAAVHDQLTSGTAAGTRHVPTVFVPRDSCGCPATGLAVSEELTRELFGQVRLLQETLNIQHELGVELLGAHDRDPRALAWLENTPALGGCLGLWSAADPQPGVVGGGSPADRIVVVGEFPVGRVAVTGTTMPVSEFPPPALFDLADSHAGDLVFVVPVRTTTRDWGVLAAVTRVQATTPPGREMMNQSGALLSAALDRGAMVAALRVQEERLRSAALHDSLTGLPNRLLLADRLEQAGLRAARSPGHRFAVLLLDLNGFKAVNDSHGHAAGDQLLIEVARRLTALLRTSDTVARLGGDEFVVLIDGIDEPDKIREAITTSLTEPYRIDGNEVRVGVSIGTAISTEGSDPDHLLREADAAMYRAKPVVPRR